jgi:acyl-coenzyme A thioesterase PaaI-like protein
MFDCNLALATKHIGELEFFIEEKDEALVTSRMPISKGMLNPFGTIHAGAMIWMADVTATVLALQNASVGPDGRGFPLAININTDMVDSCQEEKNLPSHCFPAVLVVDFFQGTQRGGTDVATVDHTDIRGLVTT